MPQAQDALSLVHEGWDHLKHQRPLAAWASWQRALRIDPDAEAAQNALDALAGAEGLPASARREYRFRTPADAPRRARWDAAFRGRDLTDLDAAAAAFAGLAAADASDADALYNRALCLAWLGRNADAVGWLDRVVEALAVADTEAAVSAWTLAGVLRQGGGAEPIADEFRHAIDLGDLGDTAELHAALAGRAVLRRLPPPVVPGDAPGRDDLTVDEWLDRDWPEPTDRPLGLGDVPRVLAIVVGNARGLRLSIPRADSLPTIVRTLDDLGIEPPVPTRTPLPLTLLDASAWTIRLPGWLGDDDRRRLYREHVEDYYENAGIARPRAGLGGLTPVEAARGDAAALARLEATIRLLEELSVRPSAIELYQGYPFDRLRRRLGLAVRDPRAIDPDDPATMSGPDLDRLDLDALGDEALADAIRSATALGEDARTARFAAKLVERRSPALARHDLEVVFAARVRLALAEDRPDDALAWIDRAIEVDAAFQGGRYRRAFTTWRAEVLARVDDPDGSLATYQSLLEATGPAEAAEVAADGAATLLDNGHGGHARRLAEVALDLALDRGDTPGQVMARALLDRLEV